MTKKNQNSTEFKNTLDKIYSSEITKEELIRVGFISDVENDYLTFPCQQKKYGFAMRKISLVFIDGKLYLENKVDYINETGQHDRSELITIQLMIKNISDVLCAIRLFTKP